MEREKEPVVAQEVAEAEYERMLEKMDLHFDGMNDEEEESLGQHRRRIIRAIMEGRLVVDEKGQPTFTPVSGGDAITFREYTGRSLMSIDGKPRKKSWDATNMMDLMADMTKTPRAIYAAMPQRDLKVCMAVSILFMQG